MGVSVAANRDIDRDSNGIHLVSKSKTHHIGLTSIVWAALHSELVDGGVWLRWCAVVTSKGRDRVTGRTHTRHEMCTGSNKGIAPTTTIGWDSGRDRWGRSHTDYVWLTYGWNDHGVICWWWRDGTHASVLEVKTD